MTLRNYGRIALGTILALFMTILPPQYASAESAAVEVNAHAYVVMDANTGDILYSADEDKRIYPASTVKLMTAVVALENAKLSTKISVKKSVLKSVPLDASTAGLRVNKTYSVGQLLNLTLIPSAADAAATVATGTLGSQKKFIQRMNAKAAELGLKGTSFDNVIGLDIEDNYTKTYSTATDIAELARYAMSQNAIRTIVAKKTYDIRLSSSCISTIKNTNQFFSTAPYSSDRYTIIGTKTGTTRAAGSVLVATARDQAGHEVICAFFGNINRTNTYQDVRELFDYTFRAYDNGEVELNTGFYDVRYRESGETILRLCEEGLLTMSATGQFHPTAVLRQENFTAAVNKISGVKLSVIDSGQVTAVQYLADMLYVAGLLEIEESEEADSDDSITDAEDTNKTESLTSFETEDDYLFLSSDEITEEEQEKLTALYDMGILPQDYDYQVDSSINKEDMVLIADQLRQYVSE